MNIFLVSSRKFKISKQRKFLDVYEKNVKE